MENASIFLTKNKIILFITLFLYILIFISDIFVKITINPHYILNLTNKIIEEFFFYQNSTLNLTR